MEKIKIIERVDALIRRKGTGTAKELAKKLNTSESFVHRLIKLMKNMGAPIYYCDYKKSYCYENAVEFTIGFIQKQDLSTKIIGGKKKNNNFFMPLSKFDSDTLYL